MSNTKTKGIVASPRLINPVEQKTYKHPLSMRIAAEKAKDHPKFISMSSKVKPVFNGDEK